MSDRPDDDPLDVVELLADDDDPRAATTESDDDDDRPRALARRPIVIVATLAVVAIVAASLSFGGDPDDADVGIAPPSTTTGRAPTTTPAEQAPFVPDVAAGPFVASLGGPIAISRGGDLFTLDPQQPAFEAVRNIDTATANVVGAAHGSLLVRDNSSTLVVGDDGTVVQVGSTPVFPASDGGGWWRADESLLTPIGFDGGRVVLPDETRAVAAVRDGFLLAPSGSGPLLRWQPGTDAVPIDGTDDATIAAVHPDRFAWYGDCPEVSCMLRVTDVATGHTTTVPTVMPIYGSGVATGRFSPDGSRLAVRASVGDGVDTYLVVVDLSTATILLREPLDGPAVRGVVAPYLQPVPFDFTRDPTRLVYADWSGRQRQLVTIDVTTGERAASNDTLRGITSVVTLDVTRTAPTAPLAAPGGRQIDGLLALREYGRGQLTLVDLADSTHRTVTLSKPGAGSDNFYGSNIVALRDGFVTATNGYAEFVARDGTVTPIGDADTVVASSDRSRAWTFNQRADGQYDVQSVDSTTGELRPERSVGTVPQFVVGDDFVRLVPASFDHTAQIERWNTRTATSRISDPAGIGMLAIATDNYFVGSSVACFERGTDCGMVVVDAETGEARPLPAPGEAYVPGYSAAGDVLYVRDSTSGLARVDLATGANETVPRSSGADQWAVSGNGTIVFGTPTAVYAWAPGMGDAELISPGRLQATNGVEIALG